MTLAEIVSGTAARDVYDRLAPFYDALTAHHDYDLWLGSLIPAAKRLGLRGNKVLDVGCGTGKSFLPLLHQGWNVTGCDISAEMLARAGEKVGDRVSLELLDDDGVGVIGAYDLVIALDDVVNYLLDAAALETFFTELKDNLALGGILLFDANTLGTYRTFFSETSSEHLEALSVTFAGQTPRDAPPGVLAEMRIEARGSDGQLLVEPVEDHQRHHPDATVRRALDGAGLRRLATFGHTEDAVLAQPLDELGHAKAIYIATAR